MARFRGAAQGCRGPRGTRAACLAFCLVAAAAATCFISRGFVGLAARRHSQLPLAQASLRSGARHLHVAMAAGGDSFDPWTVLGISPGASQADARKAYRKLIAKYHPDIDPSEEAAAKFDLIVRANAVVTGEDKQLDQASLLKNAVENMRNDIEFKQQQIANMRAKAEEEEKEIERMKVDMANAETERNKVTQELGVFGGGALGLLVGGPTGLVVGAVLGLAVKDREDGVGQLVRGTGQLAKGVANAVGNAVGKKE